MVKRGNPELRIRLDADIMELLRGKVAEPLQGRAGGVSLHVRRLIYEDLGLELPPQWGREGDLIPDYIKLVQRRVEEMEASESEPKLESIVNEMNGAAAMITGLDPSKPVSDQDARRLQSLLGRLAVLRFRVEQGVWE